MNNEIKVPYDEHYPIFVNRLVILEQIINKEEDVNLENLEPEMVTQIYKTCLMYVNTKGMASEVRIAKIKLVLEDIIEMYPQCVI